MEKVFLQACRGEPTAHTPIWLNRQAGRYMPEYHQVKGTLPSLDFFKNPDKAAQATLDAQRILGVDAAFDSSLKTVEKKNGEFIVVSRNAHLTIQDDEENLLEKYSAPYGAEILYSDGSKVEPGTLIAKWDPLTLPIIAEAEGTISFNDLLQDVTMKVDVDDLTGSTTREVIDLNDRPVKGKGMTPSLTVLDGKKKVIATYSLPSKSILRHKE